MNLIKAFEQKQEKKNIPSFRQGDTVKVYLKIVEGDKERIQVFEGVVIGRSGGGLRETFIVRRISYGVGVERQFLIHSPRIEKIEVIKKGEVRRAKLYFLREKSRRDARIKEEKNKEEIVSEPIEAEDKKAEENNINQTEEKTESKTIEKK